MSSDDPSVNENKTAQQNNAEVNINVGASESIDSVEVNNEIDQTNSRDLLRFPTQQQGDQSGLTDLITLMISFLPVDVSAVDKAALIASILAVPTAYLSFSEMIPANSSNFLLVLDNINMPHATPLFIFSVVLLGATCGYAKLRSQRECPECAAPLSLRIIKESVLPEISDDETTYGERVLECERCGYTEKRRFNRSENDP